MRRIKTFFSELRIPKSVWIITLIAVGLRFWGILYGLPLFLNIDEPSLVSGTLSLNNSLNPGRFDWPSLYFYITAGFYFISALIKPFIISLSGVPEEIISPGIFFVVSRLLSAILGSLTIPVVYLIARDVFADSRINSNKIGLIAATILAVHPLHVTESHLAKIDVSHTFFIAIAVYSIWWIYKSGNKYSYLISGFWIGVATSIKYNSFLLAISVLIAYLLRRSQVNEPDLIKKYLSLKDLKYMLVAGLLSIVAFYLGTPFALFDYQTFLSTEQGVGAMWQFQNVGSVEWVMYPEALYETFVQMFRIDLGFGLWMIFNLLLVLFVFFNKRSKEYVYLLTPTVLIALYISRLDRSPSHYFLMLIPFYVPAVASFIAEIHATLMNWKYTKFMPLSFIVGLVLLPSIWSVMLSDYKFSRLDTRNLAYTWVKDNMGEEDFLYIMGEDLVSIEFKENETKRLKRFDRSEIRQTGPFYVLIGVSGVTKESLLQGERDPENLDGNSGPVLKYSDLVFSVDNHLRYGPPIHIFKVYEVEPD